MEQLNNIQLQAATHLYGSSLILAGAGSGKTRVLTYKIANLIMSGISPQRIMALTFTNKAAKEMKERIAAIIGKDQANLVKMGTFHSVFSKILRFEAHAIGKNSFFSIYDEADSKATIKDICKSLSLDTDIYKPSKIKARISMAKNNMISAKEYCSNPQILEDDIKNKLQYLGEIYTRYEKKLLLANAMDFDDLLLQMFNMLKDNYSIREHYEDEFDAVLVDEFQDTNSVQMQILMMLTQRRDNLTVVGDDAQSIYSFRGANINNILQFQQFYPKAAVFKLGQNYRSTQTIVAAANSLIQRNQNQIHKDVFSMGDNGDKLHYLSFWTDKSEADYVARSISYLHKVEMCNFSDITILYRNNAISRAFEEYLLKMKIPYKVHGGISFFQRKDIKDILSVFKLVCNLCDDEAFARIANFPPRGIGSKTIEAIKNAAEKNDKCMFVVASEPDFFDVNCNKGTKQRLKDFCDKIQNIVCNEDQIEADEMADTILEELGIYEYINQGTEDDAAKNTYINQLFDSVQSFVAERKDENRKDEVFLHNYIQDVALLTSEDLGSPEDAVNLMTVHASKGLEFKTVYVVGLEENIFPSEKSSQDVWSLEEERRLLYVAITRAEKHCFLTNSARRWLYGEQHKNKPSRFLQDIDPRYIETIDPYADDEEKNDEEIQGYFD